MGACGNRTLLDDLLQQLRSIINKSPQTRLAMTTPHNGKHSGLAASRQFVIGAEPCVSDRHAQEMPLWKLEHQAHPGTDLVL